MKLNCPAPLEKATAGAFCVAENVLALNCSQGDTDGPACPQSIQTISPWGKQQSSTKERTLVLNESFSTMKILPFISGYKGFKLMPNGSLFSFYLLAVHVQDITVFSYVNSLQLHGSYITKRLCSLKCQTSLEML